ncbi:MAG: hypothetical protein E7666_02565 [Ruminococcaceae bacterium]|nr:hypothetical protein [Oscillospiraceae bacterium]
MKKNFIIVIFLTLLSFLIVFNSCQNNTPNNKPWKLVVLNQEIPTTQIQVIDDEVCVPFVTVLRAYGYEVEWLTDAFAVVTKNEDKYFLNLADISLRKEGYKSSDHGIDNYLCGIEGGKAIFLVVEKDILLNVPWASVALQFLGENYKTDTDPKENIVYIGCRT